MMPWGHDDLWSQWLRRSQARQGNLWAPHLISPPVIQDAKAPITVLTAFVSAVDVQSAFAMIGAEVGELEA